MENHKILVVDDDVRLRELLQRYLAQQGFSVDTLPDARDLDRKLARNRPDLLVLDVMMPGDDGLAVVRRLRAQGEQIPVIMLTARGEDIDRILGLEMGADDYLAKPFNPRELAARIHAVLRRHAQTPVVMAQHDDADEVLGFGRCELHPARRELLRDGQPVTLTTAEYAVLLALASHPRRPLTREQLMELALGKGGGESQDRSIDVHISRLRKLIEDDGAPRYLQTVWGYGYVFVPDGKARDAT